MLCCPRRSPARASSRLPGNAAKSRSSRAALSCCSFLWATRATLCNRRLNRPPNNASVSESLNDRITSSPGYNAARDTSSSMATPAATHSKHRRPPTSATPRHLENLVRAWRNGDLHLLARGHQILLQQVRIMRFGHRHARVPEDLRQLVDVAPGLKPARAERVAQHVRRDGRYHRPRRALGQHFAQPLRVLLPQLALFLELLLERGAGVRLHRHVTLLAELARDVDGAAQPVDVSLRSDTADLVEATAGAEREPDESLEARMERFQQQRLRVEREHAGSRLVLAALDAAERVADVAGLVDRALEDRLQQPAFAAHRAL